MSAELNKTGELAGGEGAAPRTIVRPTGVTIGEVMICFVYLFPYTAVETKNITLSGEWTVDKEKIQSGNVTTKVFKKIVKSGEETSYTLNWENATAGSSHWVEAAIFTYKNVAIEPISLQGSVNANTSSTIGKALPITTTIASTLIHLMAGSGGAGSAPPIGYTHKAVGSSSIYLSGKVQTVAGSSGEPEGTWNQERFINTHLIAIAPIAIAETLRNGTIRDANNRIVITMAKGTTGIEFGEEWEQNGFIRDKKYRLVTTTSTVGARISNGFLRDSEGRLIVTETTTNATVTQGYLRAPNYALVISTAESAVERNGMPRDTNYALATVTV